MSRDDDVVTGAKSGDPDAWRALYRAHAGRLVVWLRHRAPDQDMHAAEDLAGEAWLTAANKLQDFHGTADEFGGWLFGIARNLAANARRSVGRRQTWATEQDTLAGYADNSPSPSPEQHVVGEDWVRATLAQLSPRERDVIAATEVIGMEVTDAAAALGMTAVAVRVTRHRALKRLRTLATLPAGV